MLCYPIFFPGVNTAIMIEAARWQYCTALALWSVAVGSSRVCTRLGMRTGARTHMSCPEF